AIAEKNSGASVHACYRKLLKAVGLTVEPTPGSHAVTDRTIAGDTEMDVRECRPPLRAVREGEDGACSVSDSFSQVARCAGPYRRSLFQASHWPGLLSRWFWDHNI